MLCARDEEKHHVAGMLESGDAAKFPAEPGGCGQWVYSVLRCRARTAEKKATRGNVVYFSGTKTTRPRHLLN